MPCSTKPATTGHGAHAARRPRRRCSGTAGARSSAAAKDVAAVTARSSTTRDPPRGRRPGPGAGGPWPSRPSPRPVPRRPPGRSGRGRRPRLLIFSLVPWVRRGCWWDLDGVSFKPPSVVPPLTRPQLAGARRVRAAELFGQGRSGAEIGRMLGVSDESVRRWKRVWEEGGADALRRRPATGRPPKLDDTQVERVRTALEQGSQAHGF
ncbi:helix-turn-helix domain-containing protein [Streptomyces wedmorensis]